MHVDFRDLKYFEVIAELEHIGRAADRLNKTQPALTNCVRRLEDECGAILLEKSGRGVRLTAAGHVLWKWAQRARVDAESACWEIGNIGQGISGDVKLGMLPIVAQFLLPPAARDLLSEAPDVTLRTTVALSDVLSPLLRNGDIDLMVGTDVLSEPGLTSRLLAEDQVVVAAHSTHELFLRQRVGLEDLTDYRWVLHPQGAPSRDWLDLVFTRHHLPPPIVQVESSMSLVMAALSDETGLLSFISRLHLQQGEAGAGLREVKVRSATMRRRMVMTSRENGYVSPAAQRLIALLTKHAKLLCSQ